MNETRKGLAAIGLAARSVALPDAPLRPAAHQPTSVGKAKPNPPAASPLTWRQLAAARLVVQGMKSPEVARKLGTIRQTINRWKRLPAFVAELRRMHEILVHPQRNP